ncbi:hypothetical protein BC832DRAFT_593886 [Gaertneriomyces semiglobifer]|nr:hypothetical protein BC832DRAFT_593886 [Gaertneriomyces semiglobifer]
MTKTPDGRTQEVNQIQLLESTGVKVQTDVPEGRREHKGERAAANNKGLYLSGRAALTDGGCISVVEERREHKGERAAATTIVLVADEAKRANIDNLQDLRTLAQERRFLYGLSGFESDLLTGIEDLVPVLIKLVKKPFAMPQGLDAFPSTTFDTTLPIEDQLPVFVEDDSLDATHVDIYLRTLTIKNSSQFVNTMDVYDKIRPSDIIWSKTLRRIHAISAANEPTIVLKYVGITMRHPGLRVLEDLSASTERYSRMSALVKAAGSDLSEFKVHTLHTVSIPAGANEQLFREVRLHARKVQLERFINILLYLPALNVAPGGLDHAYRMPTTSSNAVDLAIKQASQWIERSKWPAPLRMQTARGRLVTEFSRLYSESMPLMMQLYCGTTGPNVINLLQEQMTAHVLPIVVGNTACIVTMHLGKDPTREGYVHHVPFFDMEAGGRGPMDYHRYHRGLVERLFNKTTETTLRNKHPRLNGTLLSDLLYGPFRNVYESPSRQDPVAILHWLQTTIRTVNPWHLVCLGSDTIGVFLHGYLEQMIVVDEDDSQDGPISGFAPGYEYFNPFGRSVNASWKMKRIGFLKVVGAPFIVRYGSDENDYAIAVGMFDPGVYAHDPFLAPLRKEINNLVTGINVLITSNITERLLRQSVIPTGSQRRAFLLDVLTDLSTNDAFIGLQARISVLRGYLNRTQMVMGKLRAGVPLDDVVQKPSPMAVPSGVMARRPQPLQRENAANCHDASAAPRTD